jgi:hypothetical protein
VVIEFAVQEKRGPRKARSKKSAIQEKLRQSLVAAASLFAGVADRPSEALYFPGLRRDVKLLRRIATGDFEVVGRKTAAEF